ncbi:uncharacterized protein [Diadema antillarum]|uniref:uncharacterized protein isoform X2 n=1 Tax=Diadema antillarum TaxID=105358 RepID=UPI003A8B7F09
MPRLLHFRVKGIENVPEDFFSRAAALASSCQIQDLDIILSADGHDVTSIGGNFARWICTMPRLSHFKIEGVVYLNEEFFSTAAVLASSCQIQYLDITWYPLSADRHNVTSIGGNFARWICTMPRLSHFKIEDVVYLNEEFFSTAAVLASSCQIQDLDIILSADGHDVTSIGGNFARWICTMPRLSHFKVGGVAHLNEEFFSTAAVLASSCQIQDLKLFEVKVYGDRQNPPSMGKHLAQWICAMPRLSLFSVNNVYLPEEFFSTAIASESLCQIKALELTKFSSPTPVIGHQQSRTAFTRLALWVCTMPRLSQFELNPSEFICKEFFATAAIFAANSKIQSLTFLDIRINDDLPHSNMIGDLARLVCNMPCLSRFRVCSSLLTTRFLSEATEMAQSCQIKDLTFSLGKFHYCDPYQSSTGRDTARWVYSIPRLSRFSVSSYFLTSEFLSAATEMAQICQIEDLTLSVRDHNYYYSPYRSSTGKDMAMAIWICNMPRLSRFSVSSSFLTSEFLSAASEMAQSCQIEDLTLSVGDHNYYYSPYRSSTGKDMAMAIWICSMPRLSRFSVSSSFLTSEFLSAATEMAQSCQIRDLTLTHKIWNKKDLIEFESSTKEGLARWVCTMPRLSRFSVKVDFTDNHMTEENCLIIDFVLDFGSSSFSEQAVANLAQFLRHMPRLLLTNLTLPELLPRMLASLATSCSVNLKSITIDGKPRNEFLTDSQQSATRSQSDSGSLECTRRRETGHGSGQECSPALCQPERSRDEPVLQEMASRDDQERRAGTHREGEQDRTENEVEPSV